MIKSLTPKRRVNNLFKNSLCFAVVLYNLTCEAQQIKLTPVQDSAFHARIIKRVPYIFEGNVTKQQVFHRKGDGWKWTCSLVQVTKIYKGYPQLKIGAIRIITMQDKDVQDAGNVSVSQSGSYIIFGTPIDTTGIPAMQANNNSVLSIDEPICFYGKRGIRWGQASYKAASEVYNFLKQNGLEVQEEVNLEQPKPEYVSSSLNDTLQIYDTNGRLIADTTFSISEKKLKRITPFESILINELVNQVHYPEIGLEAVLQGVVIISFTISDSGKLQKFHVEKTPAGAPILSEEVIRVLKETSLSTPFNTKGIEGEKYYIAVDFVIPKRKNESEKGFEKIYFSNGVVHIINNQYPRIEGGKSYR